MIARPDARWNNKSDEVQCRGDIGVIEEAFGQMNITLGVAHQVCRNGVPETVGSHADPEFGD